MILGKDKFSYDRVMLDRQYDTETVLEIHNHSAFEMSKYRFISFCGIIMEQVACDCLTGDAIFRAT